ncbi:dihydrofolate reductase family protein [Streptomyces rubellomurinus]|uniref:Deaminase n=2 Tax=Streptomyces TaxID=1883 RepID=A0A0F2THQ8_STRR3|nr:dihydrofolate reductase family protein [Streptomyces rubellomurinus]KJS57322.1 deaminase [Streptomyces rubellomurinus subsp. indigoferus]KJS57409.1 deaminase [Streptomyces rubellomurinus subsp. indigoferus]KJS61810.1 deaminase [Streptomyces rubellomurinus]
MRRRIVLFSNVSLDGYFEGPDHDLGWQHVDDELHLHFNRELARMGGFVSGRRTHELMAAYWPTADRDPAATAPMLEFADIWRAMPKTVFSRTLHHADWNTTVVREVTPRTVAALTRGPGGDLALSGGELAASFLAQDLIDEIRLYVAPVILGRGTLLFRPTEQPVPLTLTGTHRFTNGVTLLHYARSGPSPLDG